MQKRNIKIDILRIMACFMVVLIHVSAQNWYTENPANTSWLVFNFYDTSARSAALLFFMISGKLFLEREKAPDIGRLLKNNVAKLASICAVWACLYAIDRLGFWVALANPMMLLENAFFTGTFHLWFLPNMIGLYLLVPFLFKLKTYKDGKFIRYGCIAFVIFILIKTVSIGISVSGIPAIPNTRTLDFLGYLGYFLTGYYLSTKDTSHIKKRYLFLAYAIVVVVTAGLNAAYSISVGKPTELLYNYFWISTYLEAVLIFVIFQNMNETAWMRKYAKPIVAVSECTLGIYVLHVYVMEYLDFVKGFDTSICEPITAVLLVTSVIFVICLVIVAIMKQIPIVKNWVV